MNELTEARAVLSQIIETRGLPRRSTKWCRNCSRYHDGRGCDYSDRPDGKSFGLIQDTSSRTWRHG